MDSWDHWSLAEFEGPKLMRNLFSNTKQNGEGNGFFRNSLSSGLHTCTHVNINPHTLNMTHTKKFLNVTLPCAE